MSRSKGDQRGKRINGEIVKDGLAGFVNGKAVFTFGGDYVGSPIRKKNAKRDIARARRRDSKATVKGDHNEAE